MTDQLLVNTDWLAGHALPASEPPPHYFNHQADYARSHVPGAMNSPRSTLLAPEQLRRKFAALGIDSSTPEVIVYCNAGVSASFGLLALRVASNPNERAAHDPLLDCQLG